MQKEGLVETTMKKSPSGPKRKYIRFPEKDRKSWWSLKKNGLSFHRL
ncbi:PadR family transcriptional regulator [Domibacillus sp. A3M-37]|nr:PadR family transcriptional regulator [Domibacillus sp. A3M-37]MCP3763382.1 PadR family transcriptional regulator [Domibacillus sp. A3M-37]